jgi:hypothetical protein
MYALIDTFSALRPAGGFQIFGKNGRVDTLGMATVHSSYDAGAQAKPVNAPYVLLSAKLQVVPAARCSRRAACGTLHGAWSMLLAAV